MKKSLCIILGVLLVSLACSAEKGETPLAENQSQIVELSMVDKNATPETKALYSQLWGIQT